LPRRHRSKKGGGLFVTEGQAEGKRFEDLAKKMKKKGGFNFTTISSENSNIRSLSSEKRGGRGIGLRLKRTWKRANSKDLSSPRGRDSEPLERHCKSTGTTALTVLKGRREAPLPCSREEGQKLKENNINSLGRCRSEESSLAICSERRIRPQGCGQGGEKPGSSSTWGGEPKGTNRNWS